MASSIGECEGGTRVMIIITKLSEKLLISNFSVARYVLQTQRTAFHMRYYAALGYVVSSLPFIAFALRTRSRG
jgi:hypothetical protein